MIRSTLAASVLALGLTSVFAQETPAPAPAPTPAAKPAAVKADPLTDESLGKVLAGMGYEFTVGKYTSGKPYYDVTINHSGWTLINRIALSNNGKVAWMHINLGEMPTIEKVPAAVLKKLLEANAAATGKAMFAVRGNSLMLLQSFDNDDATPAKLRKEIEDLAEVVKSQAALYDFKAWLAQPTASAK